MKGPSEAAREQWKFFLTVLQALTIIGSALTAAVTYYHSSAAEQQRAAEQAQRAKETLEGVKRELRRPYEEKQLSIYLEAARTVAHLASAVGNKEQNEDRFWELYWGELAFVESLKIDKAMYGFCMQYFKDGQKCSTGETGTLRSTSIDLARTASKEVQDRWNLPLEGAPKR